MLPLEEAADRLRLNVSDCGLDCTALQRWQDRVGALAGRAAGAAPARRPQAHVICADERVAGLAAAYADALGTSVSRDATTASVRDAVSRLPRGTTVSIVLLADRLDEALVHALFEGNEERGTAGLDRLAYGLLCARTAPALGWLLAKTLVMLEAAPLRQATFARWDFGEPEASAQRLAPGACRKTLAIESPWTWDDVTLLCARAHGASFDVSLGDAVLCGRPGPDGPVLGEAHGPSCFYDGVCFRLSGPGAVGRRRLPAKDATPLVWFLDSCASVPFNANAFGTGSSYVYGLLEGQAAAVISPYLDIPTRGGLNRLVEERLAAGATLGEAAAAASAYDSAVGFDRFLLLGSPDIALLPRGPVPPGPRHQEKGPEAACAAPAVRAAATAPSTIHESLGKDRPIGSAASRLPSDEIAARARRIMLNCELLAFYSLDLDAGTVDDCRAAAGALETTVAAGGSLQGRAEVALALARLEIGLDQLDREIAAAFLHRVGTEDLSLDRLPATGFSLGATSRTGERCPCCGAALYETQSEWTRAPVGRTWRQCANCGGVSLTRDDSPVRGFLSVRGAQGSSLQFELKLRAREAVDLVLAAAPRRGGTETQSQPRVCRLAPGEERLERFDLEGARPGVVSYRVIALQDGAIDLFAARQAVTRSGTRCGP